MQIYPFTIDSSNGFSTFFNCAGDLFVYVKGSTTGASTEISVKSDLGGEVELIPGQRIRLPTTNGALPARWTIKAKDGVSPITGKLIIGAGEFDDANTLNQFKLDASFANNVTVNNTPAQRVPVNLDLTQRMPVSLDTTQLLKLDPATIINTTQNTMAYTNSYTSTAASAASTAIPMLAAAANVNGVVLNKFETIVQNASGGVFAVIAKATAPANIADGDVLFCGAIPGAAAKFSMDISKDGQPKVAPGKGIWYISSLIDQCQIRDALFTVL